MKSIWIEIEADETGAESVRIEGEDTEPGAGYSPLEIMADLVGVVESFKAKLLEAQADAAKAADITEAD